MRTGSLIFGLFLVLTSISCTTASRRRDLCDDAPGCDLVAEQRCSDDGQSLERCAVDSRGCLIWAVELECDGVCEATGDVAACVAGCEDRCPAGESRCRGELIERCEDGSGGCLDWVEGRDCTGTDQSCDDSSGEARCVGDCVDGCEPEGSGRCVGGTIMRCVEVETGCLGWDLWGECAADQLCREVDGEVDCFDVLPGCGEAGLMRCDGDVVEECFLTDDGLFWVPIQECAPGELCIDDGADVFCTSDCDDECPEEGLSLCEGTVIEDCRVTIEGCLGWAPRLDCAETGQICEEADGGAHCTGECADGCEAEGLSQCDGSVLEGCQVVDEGCLGWVSLRDCAGLGFECIEEGDRAECVPFCDAPCDPGLIECRDDSVQSCLVDELGCPRWSLVEDCAERGMGCVDIPDGAICECPEGCPEDATSCDGDRLLACLLTPDGACLSWQERENCADTGGSCAETDGGALCVGGFPGSCADPIVVTALPYQLRGDDFVADFTDDQHFTNPTCDPASSGTVEAVFSVELEAGQTLVVSEHGSAEVVLRLLTRCDDTAACQFSSWWGDERYTAPRAGTYYVVVEEDAFFPGGADYDIRFALAAFEDCEDGVDNDLDGDVDCADPDCFGAAGVCDVEVDCGDGADNDGDGALDCADTDCVGTPDCLAYLGYWESFGITGGAGLPDLLGHRITFTPDDSLENGYAWTVTEGVTDFPVEPRSAEAEGYVTVSMALGDDDFALHRFTLAPAFGFYGVDYDELFVNANGSITFGDGDNSFNVHNPGVHFELPRVSVLATDLNPALGGAVLVDEFPDQVVVTYEGILPFGSSSGTGPSDVQIVLHDTGVIDISYVTVGLVRFLAGISNGIGNAFPPETDFVTP